MMSEILKAVQQYFCNLKCKMMAHLYSQKKTKQRNTAKLFETSSYIRKIIREGQCICRRKEAHSKMHFDLGLGQDNS